MIYKWNELTYKKIAELGNNNSWCILPIGSTEQHGPHLPVGTDSLLLKRLLDLALEKYKPLLPIIVLPTLEYGESIEHCNFPGTISLSARTMLDILDDFAASITSANVSRLAILNSHGGNTSLINGYLQDLRKKFGIEVVAIHLPTIYWRLVEKYKEVIGNYFHACALETSLALSLFPELVDMSEVPTANEDDAKKFNRFLNLKDKVSIGWMTEDLSSTGVIGEPWLSNAEIGKMIADDITLLLVDLFTEVLSE